MADRTTPLSWSQQTLSPDRLADSVFVGRQAELGVLQAALEDALAGRGRLLYNTAHNRPLVLVLDNLHRADKPSLLLLEFLALELGRSRLLVLGTYRDVEVSRQHPLAETLGELTREQPLQRLRLHGLDREEVGHFIEATTGVTPPLALVEAVYSQTVR